MRTKLKLNPALLCVTALILFQSVSCKKDSNLKSVSAQTESNSTASDPVLVGWYTFDGDDLDHSGYNNNVDFDNATPTTGKHGLANTAYFFDGFSSYMTIPNSVSVNPNQITLFAVIKPMGFYQGQCHRNTILYKAYDDNTPGKYLLAYDDMAYYNFQGCDEPVQNKFQNFYGSFGDGQATAAGVRDDSTYIVKNKWYIIAFTYNKINAKFYVNGQLEASNHVSTTFTPNNAPIYIGKLPSVQFPYWFTGKIDEIRIYNKALSASQINNLSRALQKGISN
jgi:hypothetical protein